MAHIIDSGQLKSKGAFRSTSFCFGIIDFTSLRTLSELWQCMTKTFSFIVPIIIVFRSAFNNMSLECFASYKNTRSIRSEELTSMSEKSYKRVEKLNEKYRLQPRNVKISGIECPHVMHYIGTEGDQIRGELRYSAWGTVLYLELCPLCAENAYPPWIYPQSCHLMTA